MRKTDHSEKEIEELLKQMPKVKDQRGKREIYQNVSIKMNRRKRQTWLIPTAAAAAALLLMVILIPGMMGSQDSAEILSSGTEESADYSIATKESAEPSSENSQGETESTSEDSAAMDPSEEENENDQNQYESSHSESDIAVQDDYTTAVYEEDLENQEVLTYIIPDGNVNNMIPVSVVVAKEEGKSKFDLFKETMPKLTEEQWGLSDFYPLDAELDFNEEQNILTVDMPADHQYHNNVPSIILSGMFSSMMKDFDIQEIKLTTDGEPGVNLGNYGERSEFSPENVSGHFPFYLFYPNDNIAEPYFVPYTNNRLQSIGEAFDAMRQEIDIDPPLMASIPSDVEFETTISENTVVITFTDESEIEDNEETAHMIEALLLTAKEFNYDALKLENTDVETVGRFNLTQELEPPVAPNQKELH